MLLIIAGFPVSTTDGLYDNVKSTDWSEHMDTDSTFAVDLTEKRSDIGHTKFAALRVKDAVVDQFRERFGTRPSIDLERPDIRLNAHIDRGNAQLSLDLSGESLHRRGYRASGVVAPLKENLAAAILLRGDWPEISQRGGGFIDPMCGSGTLVIEAALMAGDIAPGLMRDYFGFLGWKGHDAECWEALKHEAETRKAIGIKQLPPIIGYDEDKRAIVAAWTNVEKAGLQGLVHIEKKVASDIEPVQSFKGKPGLIAVNPPYGKRLGEIQALSGLFRRLEQHSRKSLSIGKPWCFLKTRNSDFRWEFDPNDLIRFSTERLNVNYSNLRSIRIVFLNPRKHPVGVKKAIRVAF